MSMLRNVDAFEVLAPVSEAYAHLPVAEAFDWSDVAAELGPGEWYLVVFRSMRRAGCDEARLSDMDERAHLEAASAPGFVFYYKGPLSTDRTCLSFCIWTSRVEARAAAGRPHHAEAAGLVGAMYERYTLEFLRVQRDADGPLRFEQYDPPVAPPVHAPLAAPPVPTDLSPAPLSL